MGTRSAAIQIRAPSVSPSVTPSPRPAPQPSTSTSNASNLVNLTPSNVHPYDERLSTPGNQLDTDRISIRTPICRNVLLYGSCKYEKEGACQFNHQATPVAANGRKSSPSSPRKFSLPNPGRPATAAPTGFVTASLTTNAPVFVPGSALSQQNLPKLGSPAKLNMAAAEFEPSGLALGDQNTMYSHSNSSEPQSTFPTTSSTPFSVEPQFQARNPYAYDADPLHQHHESHSFNDNYLGHSRVPGPSMSNFQRPLNYHLYAPPLPHSSNQHPDQLASNSFFMPASIRETLQRKSAAVLQGPTHEVARSPEDLGVYHSLVVIDSPHSNPNSAFSHTPTPSTAVKSSGGSHQTNPISTFRAPYLSKMFKNPSWIYKAFCSLDGKAYCLYRIEGFQLNQRQGEAAIGQVERWRKVRHPAIVNVREAFTTRAFGDQSILFAFDYHPLSQSLYDEHISTRKKSNFISGSSVGGVGSNNNTNDSEGETNVIRNLQSRYNHNQSHRSSNGIGGLGVGGGSSNRSNGLSEKIVWSYVVQIVNAIKVVHSFKLAVRTIEPSKILLTGPNRVRINGCGILDVIEYSPNVSIEGLQREDLRDLGRLIISLCSSKDCSRSNFIINDLLLSSETQQQSQEQEQQLKDQEKVVVSQALEVLRKFYSKDLNGLVRYLFGKRFGEEEEEDDDDDEGGGGIGDVSIDGLMGMVYHKGFDELTRSFNHNDLLEGCLAKELENGRLVRLMAKLGFINERPEFDHDPSWSETSERYLLKLFRDYVFHQVDPMGKPVIDLSHVLSCLNKLDASLDEKVTLVSRDDQTCAIVSYAEVRRIMDSAFRELSR